MATSPSALRFMLMMIDRWFDTHLLNLICYLQLFIDASLERYFYRRRYMAWIACSMIMMFARRKHWKNEKPKTKEEWTDLIRILRHWLPLAHFSCFLELLHFLHCISHISNFHLWAYYTYTDTETAAAGHSIHCTRCNSYWSTSSYSYLWSAEQAVFFVKLAVASWIGDRHRMLSCFFMRHRLL